MHDIKLKCDMVMFGSTTLTDCQRRYSPVELETFAVVTSVIRLDYYTRGAALKSLFSKSIADVCNPRPQNMLEKIAGYRIHIVNVKGINHTVANRLSIYPVSSQLAPEFSVNPPQMCNKSLRQVLTSKVLYLKDSVF